MLKKFVNKLPSHERLHRTIDPVLRRQNVKLANVSSKHESNMNPTHHGIYKHVAFAISMPRFWINFKEFN